MSSLVQILAALLVLAAFVLAQAGVLEPSSLPYLALNAVGAAVLAVDALHAGAWGFVLLESVWAALSAWSLARAARRARASGITRSGQAGRASPRLRS